MRKDFLTFLLLLLTASSLFGQDGHRLDALKKQLSEYSDSIPAFENKVDISVSNTSLKEFLRAVAETHNLNLSLDKIPDYTITNNFEDVSVEGLIAFVCYTYHLEVKILHNIIVLYAQDKPDYVSFEYDAKSDLLSFHLVKDTLSKVAKELSDHSNYNIVLSQNVRDRVVHGFIEGLTFREAIKQLGVANDLVVEETSKNVFFLSAVEPEVIEQEVTAGRSSTSSRRTSRSSRSSSRSSRNDEGGMELRKTTGNRVSLTASETEISEAVKKVFKELSRGYFFMEEPKGVLDCHLVDVSLEDFLSIALSTAEPAFGFSKSNGVYMIGGSKNQNLHQSTVFTFNNRSVEKATESIPAALKEDVEILEYPDLNSLILTGSELRVNRLIDFLEQIDKPVANVLIEVMVVTINRGASLDVGITAGVADSSATTSGTVLSGVDLTLGSGSLNRFLGDIDRKGIINLGKVTPEFYANIQALEQESYLELQSTPKLSTLNGHEATLVIGNSVYYLIETQNVTGGVNPIITSTPTYKEVEANLEIKIKPYASYNEDVTLTIEFESSQFIDPTIEGAPPGNSTRQFNSKIRIKNEEMIVVGGLENESESKTSRGLPGIARVPILKWFFGNNSKSKSKDKLLVFIKPTIVY